MDKRSRPENGKIEIITHVPGVGIPKSAPVRVAGVAYEPEGALKINIYEWPAKVDIHRLHSAKYNAAQFNPNPAGNARFSPIRNAHNEIIPTIYGGSTFECAVMETAFHDVPYTTDVKQVSQVTLAGYVYSVVRSTQTLRLADLRSKGLIKLGVPRANLIDTEADQYAITRKWAKAIHTQHPDVQGLCWVSRRDDSALSVVLFEDRILSESGADTLKHIGKTRSVMGDDKTRAAIFNLANEIGVTLFPGAVPRGAI